MCQLNRTAFDIVIDFLRSLSFFSCRLSISLSIMLNALFKAGRLPPEASGPYPHVHSAVAQYLHGTLPCLPQPSNCCISATYGLTLASMYACFSIFTACISTARFCCTSLPILPVA